LNDISHSICNENYPYPQLSDHQLCWFYGAFYLHYVYRLYDIIEPYHFKRQLKEWQKITTGATETLSVELRCFPALLFQTLAITVQFVPPTFNIGEVSDLDALQLSQKYSDNGVELVQLLGHQGTSMIMVQHDLLRAAWLKNRGRGAEAWHALSDAIRS
jgi:hypothetical protein